MDFSKQMVKHLMLKEMKSSIPINSVLSPLSINVVLNMIAAGTTGATLKHILEILQYNSIDEVNKKSYEIMDVANNTGEHGPTITSINGVWVDKRYPLKASYAELLKRIYDCEANTDCDIANKADEVRGEINLWAEAASRGLIKNLLEEMDPQTTYVRANTLYFKGTWSYPFKPDYTSTNDFFLLNGTTIEVPFLNIYGGFKYFGSFHGYKVLKLPYKSGPKSSFFMYFFLPDEKDKLQNLIEKLEGFDLESDLEITELSVVRIPKLKFSYDFDSSETMERMGLEIPLKGNKLDYAEMIEVPEDLPPINSRILQKAYIEVDESGTEACAVTFEDDMYCSMSFEEPPPRPDFVANHPFMFVIMEDVSKLILFSGTVVNPSQMDE